MNIDKRRRAIIYVFYDKNGIADAYVHTLLSALKEHCGTLIFAANGFVEEGALKKISNVADKVILRENKGYDVSAYREAFLALHSEKLVANLDEIIFTNNSYFAPLYPLEEMFFKMDAYTALDFWGITSASGGKDIPYHIQSYFIAVRKRMFSSAEFIDFWQNMPKIENYDDAVKKVELALTPRFEKLGYKHGVYMDEICKREPNATSNAVIELIENRCPTLKRRGIVFGRRFAFNKGLDNTSLFETLRHNSDYDTSLIWENILREFPFDTYEYCLNLNKIYSECLDSDKKLPKSAVIAYARNADEYKLIKKYVCNAESFADIFIASPDGALLQGFETPLDDFGFGGLLKTSKDIVINYELVCFAYLSHNAAMSAQARKRADIHRLECVLSSRAYSENIAAAFMEDSRLGLSSPSAHILGIKYRVAEDIGDEAHAALTKVGVKVPKSPSDDFLALGSCCWIRPQILENFYANNIDTLSFGKGALVDVRFSKLLRYLAQSCGFYAQRAAPMKTAAKELQIFEARLEDFGIELLIKSWIKNKLKKFFRKTER